MRSSIPVDRSSLVVARALLGRLRPAAVAALCVTWLGEAWAQETSATRPESAPAPATESADEAPATDEVPATDDEAPAESAGDVPLDDREPWGPAAVPEAQDPASKAEGGPIAGERAVPDYDGREDAKPSAGEVILWVPRVLLSPVYALHRFVIYPPIRDFSIWTEKNNVPVRVLSALSVQTDDYEVALFPSALFDFGFRPSIGASLVGRNRGAPTNLTRLSFAWGGSGWLHLGASNRLSLTSNTDKWFDGSYFKTSFRYLDRPDQVYYGTADQLVDDLPGDLPDGFVGNVDSERTRFSRERLGGKAVVHLAAKELLSANLVGEVERNRFGDGRHRKNPIVTEVYDTTTLAGFDEGYTLGAGTLELAWDTRRGSGVPSGIRAEVFAGLGSNLGDTEAFTYLRTGGSAAVFVDVTGRSRTFGLRQAFRSVDPRSGTVPFTELVTLGGNELHRGYLEGRFRGDTGLVTSLQYDWPIWVFLDGMLFVDVGGVFGPGFEDVDPGLMSASIGTGMRSKIADEEAVHFLFALGTDPFDDGFGIDSVRLVIGSSRGF